MIFSSIDSLISVFSVDPAWAQFLIETALKTAIPLVIAGVVLIGLRRAEPGLRHFTLLIAVLATLSLPLLSQLAPDKLVPSPFGMLSSLAAASTAVPDMVGTNSIATEAETLSVSWWLWLPVLWLIGAVLVTVRFIVGGLMATRILAVGVTVTDPESTSMVRRHCDRLGLRRSVRVVRSRLARMPFVWGLFRSTVVLPESSDQWPLERLELVLLHELVHVRRHDIIWVALTNLAAAVYWFNPLIWTVRRRMFTESELIADDTVLSLGASAPIYAQHLLDIARSLRHTASVSPAGLTMAHSSHLEGRLMSILSNHKRTTRLRPVRMLMCSLIAMALIVPLGSIQIWAQNADTPQSKQDTTEYPGAEDFVPVSEYPQMLMLVEPNYPEDALADSVQGEVYVQALLNKKGEVVKAEIRKSSGHKSLDKEALLAAYKCKYKPARQDDKPVAVWITYRVEFNLDEKK